MQVRVAGTAAELAELASGVVADALRERGKRVSLALAGGSTPLATYARLRDEHVPWERVDAWMGDERWVPPDHPDSNAGAARRALVDHVSLRFHPVPWGVDDPADAAQEYQETLRQVLDGQDGQLRPDVVILGLGQDAHCASLFPGSDALEVRDRLYVATRKPDSGQWRLTATLPLLWAARRVLFLVSGASKAPAVAATLKGDDERLPARLVMQGAAEVTWLLDRAAASGLD